MDVTITHLVADEGTVVVFGGYGIGACGHEVHVRVAVDHRPAQLIAELLEDVAEITVEAEPWQVLPAPQEAAWLN